MLTRTKHSVDAGVRPSLLGLVAALLVGVYALGFCLLGISSGNLWHVGVGLSLAVLAGLALRKTPAAPIAQLFGLVLSAFFALGGPWLLVIVPAVLLVVRLTGLIGWKRRGDL